MNSSPRLLSRLVACLAWAALMPAEAQIQPQSDPQTIRWLLLDFVPYHMVDGPNKGTGLRDQYLHALTKRMPEYQHQLEVSSTERIFQFMQAGQPVCTLSMLKVPERESYTVFGNDAFFMQLPPVLIVRRGYVPPGGWKKRPGGEVSLTELLRSGEVRLGTLPKRRFGSGLDEALRQARAARPEQVLDFGEYGVLAGLLHTLGRRRFDVTLGYAIEVEQLRKTQAELGDFEYLPLVEAPGLITTHPSCSRTPWGKQVIQTIDRLPGMEAERARLREQYEALLPASERQIYRARMAAVMSGGPALPAVGPTGTSPQGSEPKPGSR